MLVRSPLLALLTLATSAALAADAAALLPLPKKVALGNGRIAIGEVRCARPKSKAIHTGLTQLDKRVAAVGGKAERGAILWVGTASESANLSALLGSKQVIPNDAERPDGYVLRCVNAGGRDVVVCLGYDERGCYYALQTLIQLLREDGGHASLPRMDIVDWPSFRVRLVKNSASHSNPALVEKLARTLPRYKINVYALQYHGNRKTSWRNPPERYEKNIKALGSIARETGVVEAALFLCPFFNPKLDMTKPEDVAVYVERLTWGLRQGFQWVEVDFNDWGTWKRANEEERAKFRNPGAYMAYLTNAAYKGVREEFPNAGVIVCPSPAYYRGRAKPGLVALCKSIPKDVLVYWTGPVTRSRHISEQQILEWTKATGHKPFLWDNTIYAHYQPYWVSYSLNPYSNGFPSNMSDLLEGGIHLNSSASELYLPGMLTFADYVWNPEAYDPERSIRAAMRLYWGEEAAAAAQHVRERLAVVHKMLQEASAGMKPLDKARAEEAVEKVAEAVKRFGEVSDNPALAGGMRRAIVANARKAVKEFKPPMLEYVRKPLADGVVNGGAEDVAEGKLVNWCLYAGAGKAKVSASPDAHTGKLSACLEALAWYHNPKHPRHGDRKWINVALLHGSDGRGFDGGDAYDVEPDMMTMAKGIGNGFPLAAVVTTPEIANVMTQRLHFNTYGGNPVCSAAGRAVLRVGWKSLLAIPSSHCRSRSSSFPLDAGYTRRCRPYP